MKNVMEMTEQELEKAIAKLEKAERKFTSDTDRKKKIELFKARLAEMKG